MVGVELFELGVRERHRRAEQEAERVAPSRTIAQGGDRRIDGGGADPAEHVAVVISDEGEGLGYQDEPYLRIGPNGVYENRRSPAVYINASWQSDVIIPGSANPEAQPEWQKVSSENVARWHDHRTHWMGNEDPPAVRRDPGHTHVVIPKWTVTIRIGAEEAHISGDLVWVPGSRAIPWLILAAVAFAVVAIVVLTSGGIRRLAAVVATLLVLDVIHTIGYASAKAGGLGTKFEQVASGSFYSVVAWAIALAAVVLLMRERRAGLFVAMIAGLVLAVLGGAIDFTDLTRSQVPFGWSPWIARLLVSISLGGGLGLAVAADIRARREAPSRLRPST